MRKLASGLCGDIDCAIVSKMYSLANYSVERANVWVFVDCMYNMSQGH